MSHPLEPEILKLLHIGKANGEIAALLNVTKGTVAGIRHRAGGNAAFSRPVKHKPNPVKKPNTGGGKQMGDLKAHDCRYPIGTPGDEGFHFCAKPRDGTSAYCEYHRVLCTARRVTLDTETAECLPT